MRLNELTLRCAATVFAAALSSCGFFDDGVPPIGSAANTPADDATPQSAITPTAAPQAPSASTPAAKPTTPSSAGGSASSTQTPASSSLSAGGTTAPAPTPVTNPSSEPTPAPSVALPPAPLPEAAVVLSQQRLVPKTMIGMHSYTYPVKLVSYLNYQASAPTFPYGLRRSLNYDGVFWYDIHVGSDPSNWNWAGLDGVINDANARGIEFMYTFLYTPAHLRWPGMEGFPSPAPNWVGSTSMPKNLDEVAAFVTAMVKRYNSGGVRKLQYIETWNEPAIDGDNFLESVGVVPYWVGSTADNSAAGKAQRNRDLAVLHKTIALAAKAADPGIKIVSPGWSPGGSAETTSYWVDWFNIAIPGGGTPKDYTDVFASHPYTASTSADHILGVLAAYDSARKAVDAAKPLMGTEAGHIGSKLSYVDHATVIKRKLILSAAKGYDSMVLYAYEDEDYLGNPWQNPETANAIKEFADAAVGKTIVRCSILTDGSVWAVFSDGTIFRA